MSRTLVTVAWALCMCFSLNVLSEPNQESPIAIGVIEERYGPVTELGGDDEKYYHYGVRPLFFRRSGRWESYQVLYNSADRGDEASSEYLALTTWRIPGLGPEVSLVSKGDVALPANLRMAVQNIVEGIDVVPNVARTDVFAGWYGMPVRPPIVVSRPHVAASIKMTPPESLSVDVGEIPGSVRKVGLEQVEEQRRRVWRDSEPPSLTADENAEILAFLSKASVYVCEGEHLDVFVFKQDSESEWIDLKATFICHDQVSDLAWVVGEGLKFLCSADFDLDGSLEYLYWIDRYNENGYLLASDKLSRVSSYIWSYH